MLNNLETPLTLKELSESIVNIVSGSSTFGKFQNLYRYDRIAFAYDILTKLGRTITSYQEEILGYFDDGNPRVAVRGPHGLGKTFIASILVHHSVLTAESDCKTITTASAWRQLEHYLWVEIRKIARYLNWTEIGRPPYIPQKELLSLGIRLSNGTVEAFAVSSDDYNTIEGAHAKSLIYIFDEAKAIPRNTWNAAEGAFANAKNIKAVKPNNDNLTRTPIIQTSKKYPTPLSHSDTIPNSDSKDIDSKIASLLYSSDIPNHYSEPLSKADNTSQEASELYRQGDGIRGENDGIVPIDPAAVSPENPTSTFDDNRIAQLPELSSITNHNDGIAHISPRPIQSDIDVGVTDYALAFAISTPGDPVGQFYDIHMHRPGYEDWLTRHVTLDEAIRAGRISRDWALQRKRQWGANSAVYLNRVLGEFSDESEQGLIPLSWVKAAIDRWRSLKTKNFSGVVGIRVLGVDVARGGDDKTVCAQRQAWVVENINVYSKLSITSTSGFIKAMAGGAHINIEITGGLGAGVYDILKEQGIPNLHAIDVSSPTWYKDKHSSELQFLNVRAAMWWNMRALLNPETGVEIALPPNEDLTLDLVTPKYEMLKDATVKLESKDEIRKRLGRSTDYGDAVCLAFWKSMSGGGVVF